MPGKIVFRYSLDTGKLSAEAQAFKGTACLKTTEKLLAGITAKVENRKLKQEYNYATEKDTVALQR